MLISRLLKILTILSLVGLAIAIGGCKLEVIVPTGGDVKSLSGTRDCSGGSLCEHNITDLSFNETFTAIARPGYVFTKWNDGHGFICDDRDDPVCKVSLGGFPEGDATVEAWLEGGHIFYAMPQFKFVGIDTDADGIADHLDEDDDNDGVFDGDDTCQLDPNSRCDIDSIVVNGRTWAQPAQFVNQEGGLSWDDVNAVCPEGVCNGTLNGRDITGWTWATSEDVGQLFAYYLGIPQNMFGLINLSVLQVDSPWAPRFFDDGWTRTNSGEDGIRQVMGHASGKRCYAECECCGSGIPVLTDLHRSVGSGEDSVYWTGGATSEKFYAGGVWLYK